MENVQIGRDAHIQELMAYFSLTAQYKLIALAACIRTKTYSMSLNKTSSLLLIVTQ